MAKLLFLLQMQFFRFATHLKVLMDFQKASERLFRHSATLSLLATFAKQTPLRWPPTACLHNLTHFKKNQSQLPDLNRAFLSQASCLLFSGVSALCRRHPCRLFLPVRSAFAPLLGSNSFWQKKSTPKWRGFKNEPTPGLEPSTYALRVRCSTR